MNISEIASDNIDTGIEIRIEGIELRGGGDCEFHPDWYNSWVQLIGMGIDEARECGQTKLTVMASATCPEWDDDSWMISDSKWECEIDPEGGMDDTVRILNWIRDVIPQVMYIGGLEILMG